MMMMPFGTIIMCVLCQFRLQYPQRYILPENQYPIIGGGQIIQQCKFMQIFQCPFPLTYTRVSFTTLPTILDYTPLSNHSSTIIKKRYNHILLLLYQRADFPLIEKVRKLLLHSVSSKSRYCRGTSRT